MLVYSQLDVLVLKLLPLKQLQLILIHVQIRIKGAKQHLFVHRASGGNAVLFPWDGKESAIVPL